MSSSAFSASASASASATYGACADVDPMPLTLDVLDALEAGVAFGAIGAGQGRIVPAAVRAGNSNSKQSEYTRAFDEDTDDDEDDEGDARTGPLALRPRDMGDGLPGGEYGSSMDTVMWMFLMGLFWIFVVILILVICGPTLGSLVYMMMN